jgi:hypothetical protein
MFHLLTVLLQSEGVHPMQSDETFGIGVSFSFIAYTEIKVLTMSTVFFFRLHSIQLSFPPAP